MALKHLTKVWKSVKIETIKDEFYLTTEDSSAVETSSKVETVYGSDMTLNYIHAGKV